MLRKTLAVLLLLIWFLQAYAVQESLLVSGYVFDNQSKPIELVGVSVFKGKQTCMTDQNGYYELNVPLQDTIILQFNCLSYQTATRIIPVETKKIRLNINLNASDQNLKEVTIQGSQSREGSFERLDASRIRLLPDATGGSIEALLVTFAGVNSNNELSSQYSVRGGNYDENLVYVNGTEVYRPLLIRAGQQEGMSFVNPEMVQEVKFSAGGFDVKYGDKMSSVLDISYKKPKKFESVVNLGLLGTNVYLGQASKSGRFTQIHGFRYKTNEYLLGTLDTKAEYNPSFLDYQTFLTWKLNPTTEWSFLGNFSKNSYEFIPVRSETAFGTYNQKITMYVDFEGQERDLFQTLFGAMTLQKRISNNLKMSLSSSVFSTAEDENYDITGEYTLSQTPIQDNQTETDNSNLLGQGKYHEHARNHLNATVLNISQSAVLKIGKHQFESGLSWQHEQINDNLREWQIRDSAGYTLPYSDNQLHTTSTLISEVDMSSNRIQAYIQDHWRFRTPQGLFSLTAGIRSNYWTFNNEWLLSPRVSMSFTPSIGEDYTFRLATGTYYQAPFYKELRDTQTIDGVTRIVLNRQIKAQKSQQIVAGMDYHFIGLDRPFKLTTEFYYKDLQNIIPYTVDNVRIRYFGKNMAKGYTTGFDAKLFGELVPGSDSWISFSLLRSRETIQDYTVPRPNESRYNISVFFQDYFPNNPKITMSLKVIWADGLPTGPPDGERRYATLRLPPYRRVDIGISRLLVGKEDKIMKSKALSSFKKLWLGLDCFNLLGIRNTNSYYWVSDFTNQQWGIPNYLTGRLMNIRISAEF
jgi:hypothetical protein